MTWIRHGRGCHNLMTWGWWRRRRAARFENNVVSSGQYLLYFPSSRSRSTLDLDLFLVHDFYLLLYLCTDNCLYLPRSASFGQFLVPSAISQVYFRLCIPRLATCLASPSCSSESVPCLCTVLRSTILLFFLKFPIRAVASRA